MPKRIIQMRQPCMQGIVLTKSYDSHDARAPERYEFLASQVVRDTHIERGIVNALISCPCSWHSERPAAFCYSCQEIGEGNFVFFLQFSEAVFVLQMLKAKGWETVRHIF